jgi:hypothetical protein
MFSLSIHVVQDEWITRNITWLLSQILWRSEAWKQVFSCQIHSVNVTTGIFMSYTLSECHWSTNTRIWWYSIDCWSPGILYLVSKTIATVINKQLIRETMATVINIQANTMLNVGAAGPAASGSSAFNDSYGILLPCMYHDNCLLIASIW